MSGYPRIHDPAPQWRNEGEQDHAGVSGWQHRRCGLVPERLVPAGRVRVVITVPLQVVEQDVRGDVIGVPAVRGIDSLIPHSIAVADPLAQQPVVLEVVHRLEERDGDQGLEKQVRHQSNAEPDEEATPQHRRDEPGAHDVVVPAKGPPIA